VPECRSCAAPIIWAATAGSRMPLDVEPVEIAAVGLVAYNPATGNGLVLSAENIGKVDTWRSGGVTVHRAHSATCPSAEQHRVHEAQESLL
jgi:hypothetical protein